MSEPDAGGTGLPPSMPGLPPIPQDDGGPAFLAPWHAQAFAAVIQLHKAGLFTWVEWAAALGAEIRAAQAAGDADLGDTYYLHWLAALEALVEAKRLASPAELAEARARAFAAASHHDHVARREPVAVA